MDARAHALARKIAREQVEQGQRINVRAIAERLQWCGLRVSPSEVGIWLRREHPELMRAPPRRTR